MTVHYPTVAAQVHRRYPFFRSTFTERRLLFQRQAPQPGSIQPAAGDGDLVWPPPGKLAGTRAFRCADASRLGVCSTTVSPASA
jgi:hypothetical protein